MVLAERAADGEAVEPREHQVAFLPLPVPTPEQGRPSWRRAGWLNGFGLAAPG